MIEAFFWEDPTVAEKQEADLVLKIGEEQIIGYKVVYQKEKIPPRWKKEFPGGKFFFVTHKNISETLENLEGCFEQLLLEQTIREKG